MIPLQVTLNDAAWPFYIRFCFCASTFSFFREFVAFEDSCVQIDEDRLILKCSAGSPVSGNIKFMWIFTGVI